MCLAADCRPFFSALSVAMWISASVVATADAADAQPTSKPADQVDVLLITVDTLRADHLGCYGHRLDTSPTIDRLAAEGVRFADATVQWPKTWPSMASMLTGTYPSTNGVRCQPRRPLPARNITLAEVLRQAGYRTAAVVANVNVGKAMSFDQGFGYFVESWVDELIRQTGKATFKNAPGKVKHYTNATIVTDEAIRWLETVGKQDKFFLWLHYMEPHGPYLAPEKYRSMFTDAYPPEPVGHDAIPQYQRQIDPKTGTPSGDLAFYKAQYDREIRYFDDELSRLLKAVEQRGLRRNTLIILTADHGESLSEHNYYLRHGWLPYQPGARVPLIMVLANRLPAGRVVRAPVGLIDLMPTILDLLDLPIPETLQGVSLLPLLRVGDEAAPAYVFMEAGKYDPPHLVVRRGPWKLIRRRTGNDPAGLGAREYELYHIWDDPKEMQDVAAKNPKVVEELKAALGDWLDSTAASKEQGERIDPDQLDESTRELLRALGYLK